MGNPFKFTDRTYQTILNSLNLDQELSDKPEWLKRAIAGYCDTLQVMINATANDNILETAFSRNSVQSLLRQIAYELGRVTTSNGFNIFNMKNTTPDGTIFSTSDLKASTQGSISSSIKKFEPRISYTYNKVTSITFTRTSASLFTTPYNFIYTGKKVRLQSTSSLPGGLFIDTDYYIIYVSPTTFRLALSITNAFNNVYVSTTDAGTGIHTITVYSLLCELYQQETIPQKQVGISDGITPFQEITLPDKFVIEDTLIITISSQVYTKTTSIVDNIPTDRVFSIVNNSNDTIKIVFGNNEFGCIPPANIIYAQYAVGGGSNSNIPLLNKINVYSGSSQEITSTANVTSYNGGNDEENIEIAKKRAPILLKSRDRFITVSDGEALALSLGGISYIKIYRNVYRVLSCQIFAVASGGGNPTLSKKNEISQYLLDRSVLESILIIFDDISFIAPTIVVDIKLDTGYTSSIFTYIDLAIKLFFSETSSEILQKYESYGISETVTLINTIFSTSFVATEYSIIEPLVKNLIPLELGETIHNSDIVSYIKSNVNGIDNIVFTSPLFPVTLTGIQMTTHTGMSITINEVT